MDNIYSNGLGNFALFIACKKKIYVNRNGNIAQSCRQNSIKINYTDQIKNESFNNFRANNFDNKLEELYGYKTKKEVNSYYTKLFDDLMKR